jgi:type II secretory pathway component PulF
MRQKPKRAHPYRNLINALLLTLVFLFAMSFAIYLIDAARAARYHFLYRLVGVGGVIAVAVFIRFAFRVELQVKADNGVNLAEGGTIDSSHSSHDSGH